MDTLTFEATVPVWRSTLASLIECVRPTQWIKNGFVVAPLIFSGKLLDPQSDWKALGAALAFCLVASSVYLWNDILDCRTDLMHPNKRSRPIAAGRLSVRTATLASLLLLAAGVVLGMAVTRTTGALLCGYAVMNILYSVVLKHVVVMDLMCVAMGFVLRVLAGTAAISAHPSHWLLMCTFLLALTLSVFRRRQEALTLRNRSADHRRVLADYSITWFDQAGTMLSAATIMAYAIYTVSPETQARFGTNRLIYTLPFVVFGTLRYLHLVHRGDYTGNPTSALLLDKPLLGTVLAWVASCALVIYTRLPGIF